MVFAMGFKDIGKSSTISFMYQNWYLFHGVNTAKQGANVLIYWKGHVADNQRLNRMIEFSHLHRPSLCKKKSAF